MNERQLEALWLDGDWSGFTFTMNAKQYTAMRAVWGCAVECVAEDGSRYLAQISELYRYLALYFRAQRDAGLDVMRFAVSPRGKYGGMLMDPEQSIDTLMAACKILSHLYPDVSYAERMAEHGLDEGGNPLPYCDECNAYQHECECGK